MIRINPQYEGLRQYIERLPSVFESEGREIYRKRNLIKVFQAPDGTELNVKRYHVPHGLNALVYSLGIRKSKGLRAWEYPALLKARGIETPEPVAYIEERCMGLLRYSYFVSQQCPYAHTLYDMAQAEPSLYEPMAKALADYAAHMHEEGVLHKDFTPGNILWQRAEDGTFHFSLVDINRLRFGQVNTQEGLRSLVRLWGPKRFIQLLARAYATRRGADADRAEADVMQWRARFWRRYAMKHKIPFPLEL